MRTVSRRSTRTGQVHPLELGSTKARLYIDCARPSDGGLYTCVAETTTKRITTTTLLHVGQFSVPANVITLHSAKKTLSGELSALANWATLKINIKQLFIHNVNSDGSKTTNITLPKTMCKYYWAKFVCDRCSSLDILNVSIFGAFGRKTPTHVPQIGVSGLFHPLNGLQYPAKPKVSPLHESVSYEPSSVKIWRAV